MSTKRLLTFLALFIAAVWTIGLLSGRGIGQISSHTAYRFRQFTADPSSPNEGDVYENNSTHAFRGWNGSSWQTFGGGGGGGITNSAPANHLMKSDGTNAVDSTGTVIIAALTSNGFVKTSGGIGTLSVDTTTYVPTTTTVNGKALSGNITLGLASADFANQGTTTTLLHGNAAGNPSFGQVVNADIASATIDLTAKVTGALPIANGGTGTGSTLTGLVRGNASAMTAAELSGDATTSGSNVVTLANTAVTAGSYTSANITVDSKGRITSAANGSGGGANPAGSGSEIQARLNGTTFQAITNSTSSSGTIQLLPSDSGTTNVLSAFSVSHNTSGTPAANYGVGIRFGLQSTTTADRDAGLVKAFWSTATDASRSSTVSIQAVDTAGSLADVVQFSFAHNGGSPVAQIISQGTTGQTGIPQFTNAQDPTTGIRSTTNVFITVSGSDHFQFTGTTMFANQVALDFNNGDVGIARTSAGLMEVDSGAVGTFRDLKLRTFQQTGLVTLFNNVATEGYGHPGIYKSQVVTAQSAANSNIAQFTVGASDGIFDVSMDMSVTAATALSTSMNCDYTDAGNTARTMIFPTTSLAGSFLAGGLVTATGAFETPTIQIRAKAGTTVTLYTATGTFTGVTYSAGATIKETK